jgi:hypothetical protein
MMLSFLPGMTESCLSGFSRVGNSLAPFLNKMCSALKSFPRIHGVASISVPIACLALAKPVCPGWLECSLTSQTSLAAARHATLHPPSGWLSPEFRERSRALTMKSARTDRSRTTV